MDSAPAPIPGQLTIASQRDADDVTLTVCGEIDIACARALDYELREAESSRPRRIELHLAALDFIDSAGVHVLIEAQGRAGADGHQFVVTHVPPHARRLFDLTGLSALVTFE